jgi:hypothetical protein
MQMALSRCAPRRAFLIVLLLCATVYAEFAALSDSHAPHFPNDHCCLLCHIGVLPFLQPDSDFSAAQAAPIEWLASDPDCVQFHDAFLVSRSSRAPPATLSVSAV